MIPYAGRDVRPEGHLKFEFITGTEDVVMAARHGAMISFPAYKAALPWTARSVGPLTVLDVIFLAAGTVIVGVFRPWTSNPVQSAIITACVFAMLLLYLLIVRLICRTPARTAERLAEMVEKLTRRLLARDPSKASPGSESASIEGADVVFSSVNGSAVIPIASIEHLDLTSHALYLVRNNSIVAGVPLRAIGSDAQLRPLLDRLGRPVRDFRR